MDTPAQILFTTLEFEKNLPRLDLHHVDLYDIERILANFLSDANGHYRAVEIIYGKGSGLLREKTINFLAQNSIEKDFAFRFVKAWREAELVNPGGRCLVLLENN